MDTTCAEKILDAQRNESEAMLSTCKQPKHTLVHYIRQVLTNT